MSIGKLKLQANGLFASKWNFYEYSRHSLRWSNDSAVSLMEEMNNDNTLSQIVYIQTINMYIQLVAAYTAAHLQYIYRSGVIPASLFEPTSSELTKGLDEGIDAFTINNQLIDKSTAELFKNCVHKYLNDGLVKDDLESTDSDPQEFNPDIDNFTKLFIGDSKHLSERDNSIIIEELHAYSLSQVVASIPLNVYKKLSNMSVTYIPAGAGFFG